MTDDRHYKGVNMKMPPRSKHVPFMEFVKKNKKTIKHIFCVCGFTVWPSCFKIHPNGDSWEYVAHYHAVTLRLRCDEMEFSDLHPSPPGPLAAGAVSEPLEWSRSWHCHLELAFHTGHAKGEKKGLQYDKWPAQPSQTPSTRFLNQNQKLFISKMYSTSNTVAARA